MDELELVKRQILIALGQGAGGERPFDESAIVRLDDVYGKLVTDNIGRWPEKGAETLGFARDLGQRADQAAADDRNSPDIKVDHINTALGRISLGCPLCPPSK